MELDDAAVATAKAAAAAAELDLRFEARDEVTTAPIRAERAELLPPSVDVVATLLRGEKGAGPGGTHSDSPLPRLPERALLREERMLGEEKL